MMNSTSHILRGALQENFALYLSGKNTWMKSLAQILQSVNADHILYTSDTSEILLQLKSLQINLQKQFLSRWRVHKVNVQNNPDTKLSLFASLLNKFECAPYINAIQNYKSRCSLSRFRLSAHNLPIETLRYSNTPRNLRLCPFCCKNIGDEAHYILNCPYPIIASSRENIMDIINSQGHRLTDLQKTICILNEKDPLKACHIGHHLKTINNLFIEEIDINPPT